MLINGIINIVLLIESRKIIEKIYLIYFTYLDEISKTIYTTSAIESLNSVIRKVLIIKIFSNNQYTFKAVFLATNHISK